MTDGRKGATVDINDVVAIKEFGQAPANVAFSYNAGSSSQTIPFLTIAEKAGDEVGFTIFWPYNEGVYYRARDVFYGVSHWNPQKKSWEQLVDKTMVSTRSKLATDKDGREYQLAQVRYRAPQAGTYRMEVVSGGDLSSVTTIDYDLKTGEYAGVRGHTYIGNLGGHTQSPVYFYIPKGAKSVDMEVYDTYGAKSLQLFSGLPENGLKPTRVVDISAQGTHVVPLEAGEDGTVAMIKGNGFAFPYLYSAPMLWAKSPASLLIPRDIAKADGLTIVGPK